MFVDVFNNLGDFFALKVRFGITGYTFLYNGSLLKPSPVQTRCDGGKQIPVAYTRYHRYILVHLIQILPSAGIAFRALSIDMTSFASITSAFSFT